jgi:DNA replication and repair protein RecF
MLQRFEAYEFRCFERLVLPLQGRSVGLVGPNGAGKTSILEGLFFLSYGRSFRVQDRRLLVRRGAAGFRLKAEVSDPHGTATLGVRWTPKALEAEINGIAADGIRALAGRLPPYLIDPSVHQLLEGLPQERRRLLDTGVFHVEPTYLDCWRRYRRTLKQRNAALKSPKAGRDAPSWDQELAAAATELDAARQRYIDRWARLFRSVAAALGFPGAGLEYRRGWDMDVDLQEALRVALPRDIAMGTCTVGPHRADVVPLLDRGLAKRIVSRGQQKLLASALIISQLKMVAGQGHQPVLLLDDPGAELDVDNCGKFLEVVRGLNVQTVATATFPAALEALPGLALFHVKPAGLEPML